MAEDEAYVALIGDIRGSRQTVDRAGVQESLEDALQTVNDQGLEEVSEMIPAARLVVTAGDEFQGLYYSANEALLVARELTEILQIEDVGLRFGVGRGVLTTPLRERAIGMDGPCFHQARAALKAAKEGDGWVRVQGWGDRFDGRMNSLLDLAGCVRRGWTPRQAQFVQAYRRQGRVQRRVAEAFQVSPSVVSESLSAASLPALEAAEATIRAFFASPEEGDPGGSE